MDDEMLPWGETYDREFGSAKSDADTHFRHPTTMAARVRRIIAHHPRFAETRDLTVKAGGFDFQKAAREALTMWILDHEDHLEEGKDPMMAAEVAWANRVAWTKWVDSIEPKDVIPEMRAPTVQRLQAIAERTDSTSLRREALRKIEQLSTGD